MNNAFYGYELSSTPICGNNSYFKTISANLSLSDLFAKVHAPKKLLALSYVKLYLASLNDPISNFIIA